MTLKYQVLKTRQRELRDGFPEPLALRTHRALSWLQRAEQEPDDADARFIFLWIAFNAAYAREIEDRTDLCESQVLRDFLSAIVNVDEQSLLYHVIWKQFPGHVRLLLDNRYVFQPFWDYVNLRIPESAWQARFERSRQVVNRALGNMDTPRVLSVIFDRLYTLRNQLVHGGATWNSSVNRQQVTECADLLGQLVPIIVHLMMENPELPWTDAVYPVME